MSFQLLAIILNYHPFCGCMFDSHLSAMVARNPAHYVQFGTTDLAVNGQGASPRLLHTVSKVLASQRKSLRKA